MTLSTWQLIVVAGLATIWAVVLGVPLLADLLRWLRSRPPAPRIDRRTTRRNLVASIENAWWHRPRPVRSWRTQDVAQKRLQLMLACAIATTVAMFLAIALRGLYVQLFLAMLAFSLVTLAVAAFVGAAEDENLVDQLRARRRSTADRQADDGEIWGDLVLPGLLGSARLTEPDEVPTANPFAEPDGEISIPTLADITEAFRSPDRSGFMFEPLNLDELRGEVVIPEAVAEELSNLGPIDVPVDPDLAAELGLPVGEEPSATPASSLSDGVAASSGECGEAGESERPPDVRFSAAPDAGSRQASARARRAKRSKARPIYIESVLDEDDKPGKVIND